VHLQSYCRFLLYRRKYVQCKRGFVLLQSVVRKNNLQSKAFNNVPHRINKVNAKESETEIEASKIQFLWPNHIISSQKRNQTLLSQFIQIQALYRMRLIYNQYRKVKRICIKIQSRLRGSLVRKEMNLQSQAACGIQSFFRSCQTRMQIKNTNRSTSLVTKKKCDALFVIQRWIKMKHTRHYFLELRISVIVLQSLVRSLISKRQLHSIKSSVLVLQHAIRIYLYRLQIQRKKVSAATLLQSWYRSFILQKRYISTVQVILKIQSWFKCNIAMTKRRHSIYCIVLIQSVVRRYLSMEKINQTSIEEERIRSKVQKMAETEISYNLSGKVRAADITSLLMKVTNNDCDMLNTISKKVLKNMPNYNYSSTNNTHKPLPESSLSRYSESDNKQFVEMDITKSLNIDNDYRTDRNLQKAHKSLPDVETYVVNEQESVSTSDSIQEARLILSKAKLQSNLDEHLIKCLRH